MITQCSMRHLYTTEPRVPSLIEQAKTYERRRCNHHELENPLSTFDCLSEVVDSKSSRTNKHKYIVASQDADVRAHMRNIPGVPLIYINRSVMIMEPMARATEHVREEAEKGKFKAGLKGGRGVNKSAKRAREEPEDGENVNGGPVVPIVTNDSPASESKPNDEDERPARKKRKGPKGANPLSVKKPKKRTTDMAPKQTTEDDLQNRDRVDMGEGTSNGEIKRKRKRKHKTDKGGGAEERLLDKSKEG